MMDWVAKRSDQPAGGGAASDSWVPIPRQFRHSNAPLPPAWERLYGPLRAGRVDDLMVIAQCGQSIDGRIATASGHSKYINGASGLDHLHRLRALVDAVVVGVGTALNDDPQLTVRRVAGPNPARVVIDPRGRLPAAARLWRNDGARRVAVMGEQADVAVATGVEILPVVLTEGVAAPADILAGLRAKGFRRILIEGGARTVSEFLAAGCLDRLHVMVAPMLLGAGQPSLTLAPIERADDALRPPVFPHLLDGEVLFDIDLSSRRRRISQPA
jgi:diaminohydroxyphosphoribosylaminopyrimidine deaminase / 5-amino-6-(5-phosphoribosylamino)uracil reductase